tara:strand:- start:176 stop:424 length:249 start_codon:yes stop_codon:yes gene_type:complete
MADIETMLNWAGYDDVSSLIQDKLSQDDIMDLFWELLNADALILYDVVYSIVDQMGFVDHEQVKADYEDQKYQEWKERGLDD